MACSQTLTGIPIVCGSVNGGLDSTIYFRPKADPQTVTLTADNVVTGITFSGANSGLTYISYSYELGNAGFVSTLSNEPSSQNKSCTTVLTLTLNKMDQTKRNEVEQLMAGRVHCIVKDQNGIYWFLSPGNEGGIITAVANSGSQMTDPNNFVITFTAVTRVQPQSINSDVITTAVVDVVIP